MVVYLECNIVFVPFTATVLISSDQGNFIKACAHSHTVNSIKTSTDTHPNRKKNDISE